MSAQRVAQVAVNRLRGHEETDPTAVRRAAARRSGLSGLKERE